MKTPLFLFIALIALLAIAAVAQAPRPAFEVASVRDSGPVPDGSMAVGMHADGAQIRGNYFSLRDYIAVAYRLRIYQIAGPDWIETKRFDIAATLPAGATRAKIPDMLQTLLEDRFKLKYHHEHRDFPVYALSTDKDGVKLRETPPDPDAPSGPPPSPLNVTAQGSTRGVSINLGGGSSYVFADNRFEAKKVTMLAFSAAIERFVDRPVIDRTGLTANYDFAIDLTPEDYRAMLIRSAITAGVVLPPQARQLADGAADESLFEGLKKLGLRLERTKAPLDTFVVDDSLKTPLDN